MHTALKNRNLKSLMKLILDVSKISDEWDERCIEFVDIIYMLDDYIDSLENNQGTE